MATRAYDVTTIRRDFPILTREVRPDVPLVYLDNAATSQKPLAVIEAMDDYYRRYNANVHRGIHTLSEEATAAYEGARETIADFINAASSREIIYTKHATEAINIVVWSWGFANLGEGDVVLTTEMEHHANIVPWQIVAERVGATMRYVPVTPEGTLDLEVYYRILAEEPVKMAAFNHVSNVTGSVQPVDEMIKAAHEAGALVCVDGAQSVPHMPVDVQALNADFYAFSSHKMCGPTGIGVLWGREELLEAMPPFMGGGDMIRRVSIEGTTFNELPWKFEAGTPSIAEAIGLGAAVDYLTSIGMEAIHAHEEAITRYALERLREVPGLTLIGPEDVRAGLTAFTLEGCHPHDIAAILDHYGIAVRAGHHCAQPLHSAFDMVASARASYYLYTTRDEVDQLIDGLHAVRETFNLT